MLVSACAATILIAYACDVVRLPFTPLVVTPLAVVATGLVGWQLAARVRSGPSGLLGYLAVLSLLFGWLLWRAAPSFLPLGSQGDLTHHLQLVDYIERHWQLPRGDDVDRYLGEMAHYTPGLHTLAALAGWWLRSDGLHVIHGLVAAAVALKIGFVYLVGLRLLPRADYRVRLSVAAAALAIVPYEYSLDSFMRDGFLAQALAETFVLGMWWAVSFWDAAPTRWPLALFGVLACAAFLTWPIYVGPPLVALAGLLVFRPVGTELPIATRVVQGAWALVPPATLATLYISGRSSLLGMSGASGAVIHPGADTYGPVVLTLALGGLLAGWRQRHARSTLWFLLGIAAQSSVLSVQSLATGNASAYMAFKTLYLLPYAFAVLALMAVPHDDQSVAARRMSPRAISWLFFVFAVSSAVVSLLARRAEVRAVTEPMWRAGVWARDHVPRGCIVYMVPDGNTAYWLHLAVLRNPRASERTADDATYDLTETTLRWYGPAGLPYAIIDLNAVSASVREDLEELVRFDSAAVARRRGPATCADEHLPAAP